MTVKAALAILALLSATAPSAFAEDASPFAATTLHLSASGEAHAAPTIATINFGVQTDASTAAGALRQNRVQMTATIAALKAQGVLAKDIQTSSLNLNPQYVFHEGQPQKLTGYQASNSVGVTVRDLAQLGAAVDAVVAAGANQINGIGFGLADPQHAEDEARRAAVKSLQAKAALYAEAAGYRVARLVSLSDTTSQPTPFQEVIVTARRKSALASTPTEPGELEVTANVSAVFELKK